MLLIVKIGFLCYWSLVLLEKATEIVFFCCWSVDLLERGTEIVFLCCWPLILLERDTKFTTMHIVFLCCWSLVLLERGTEIVFLCSWSLVPLERDTKTAYHVHCFPLLLLAKKCCPRLLPDLDQPDRSLRHGGPQWVLTHTRLCWWERGIHDIQKGLKQRLAGTINFRCNWSHR